MLLANIEYDDYDCLIQLCDAIAKDDGIVSLEERMNDVKKDMDIIRRKNGTGTFG